MKLTALAFSGPVPVFPPGASGVRLGMLAYALFPQRCGVQFLEVRLLQGVLYSARLQT